VTGQSKKHSVLESLTNVIIGYLIALLSQLIVFPLYGIHIPLSTNLWIGIWFTASSLIRSYLLRRVYNKLTLET